MTIDEYKSLAAAVQSAVIALGVVIGGIWTVWTFTTLKQAEKAKLDLEVQQLRRPAIELSVVVTQLDKPDSLRSTSYKQDHTAFKLGLATVTVRNLGNKTAEIDISQETLFVRRLNSVVGTGVEGFQGTARKYIARSTVASPTKVMVLPSNKQELSYLLELEENALFQIEFSVQAPTGAAGQLKAPVFDAGGTVREAGGPTWSTYTFVSTNGWK